MVNNYPSREKIGRLESCLEGNGATIYSIEWNEASAPMFNSHDAVVLSGSPDMMSQKKTLSKFEKEADAITDSNVPILGICFGHQLMAHAFGTEVVKDRRHVLEMVKTSVLADDPFFEGLPKSLMLLESRYEVVKALPAGFSLLARSTTSAIATMKDGSRLLYGVQFHPELYTAENPDGNKVVGNFIRLLK